MFFHIISIHIFNYNLYFLIKLGAESGIDFSSRWFNDPLEIQTIHKTDIIPIDLNSLFYKIEMNTIRRISLFSPNDITMIFILNNTQNFFSFGCGYFILGAFMANIQ